MTSSLPACALPETPPSLTESITLAEETLFTAIARDLRLQGYSIQPQALPVPLAQALLQDLQDGSQTTFVAAGIGRANEHQRAPQVRRDAICWLDDQTEAGRAWLTWTAALQTSLNRQLLLGLFSFESHFAHYGPGDYYRRHRDAFRGQANRVLSLVVYLNPDWQAADGGELVLYRDDEDHTGLRVLPALGTLVAFLSEDFPHEVLAARRDRYSIAGWYRVNTTSATHLDPPL